MKRGNKNGNYQVRMPQCAYKRDHDESEMRRFEIATKCLWFDNFTQLC